MNNVQEESLRDQKKNRRRLQILEIARGIIASKGLRSLKVRDVAEAAGCSVGSVYNEFGDFDGVILTVNRETVQALTVRLGEVPAEDPVASSTGLPRPISNSSPNTPICCARCSSIGWRTTVLIPTTSFRW